MVWVLVRLFHSLSGVEMTLNNVDVVVCSLIEVSSAFAGYFVKLDGHEDLHYIRDRPRTVSTFSVHFFTS